VASPQHTVAPSQPAEAGELWRGRGASPSGTRNCAASPPLSWICAFRKEDRPSICESHGADGATAAVHDRSAVSPRQHYVQPRSCSHRIITRRSYPARWNGSGDPLGETGGSRRMANQIQRYLGAVLRYKWIILGCCILGGIIGAIVSRNSKPVYDTQAIFWIEVGQSRSTIWPDPHARVAPIVGLDRSPALVRGTGPRGPRSATLRGDGFRGTAACFGTFELQPTFRPGKYRLEVSSDGEVFTLSSQGTQIQRGTVGDSIGIADRLPVASRVAERCGLAARWTSPSTILGTRP
jgi:hypothetical protein